MTGSVSRVGCMPLLDFGLRVRSLLPPFRDLHATLGKAELILAEPQANLIIAVGGEDHFIILPRVGDDVSRRVSFFTIQQEDVGGILVIGPCLVLSFPERTFLLWTSICHVFVEI